MANSNILRFNINFTFTGKGAITLTAKSEEEAVKRFKDVSLMHIVDSGALNRLDFENVNLETIEEYKPKKQAASAS